MATAPKKPFRPSPFAPAEPTLFEMFGVDPEPDAEELRNLTPEQRAELELTPEQQEIWDKSNSITLLDKLTGSAPAPTADEEQRASQFLTAEELERFRKWRSHSPEERLAAGEFLSPDEQRELERREILARLPENERGQAEALLKEAEEADKLIPALLAKLAKQEEEKLAAAFIASYTGTAPEDIQPEDIQQAQAFWEAHPEALTDVFSCMIDDSAKPDFIEGLTSKTKGQASIFRFTFGGGDLYEAFWKQSQETREAIVETLKKGAIYTQRYTRAALLPYFSSFVIQKLTRQQKEKFAQIISTGRTPREAELAALLSLYLMLFSMADEATKDEAAEALGISAADMAGYLYRHGTPSVVEFPRVEEWNIYTKEEKEETETSAKTKKEAPKMIIPQLPPQKYGGGYYPLGLTLVNRGIWGIPLDGKFHQIGQGEYQYKVKLTVEKMGKLLPFPLDDWADKISLIIGYGQKVFNIKYFDVEAIARFITFGDPDAHTIETRKGGKRKGEKIKKLKPVPLSTIEMVNDMIAFMGGIISDSFIPVSVKDKKGKKQTQMVHITKPLLSGGVRVEVSNYGNTTRSYWKKDQRTGKSTKTETKRQVWFFPSVAEEGPFVNNLPLLYEIATMTGEIALIPAKEADMDHYLGDGKHSCYSPEDVKLRDATLRRYFQLQRNARTEGKGLLDLGKLEDETGITAISEAEDLTQAAAGMRRKRRKDKLEKIVGTMEKDGKIFPSERKSGDVFEIQTTEVRKKQGKFRKAKRDTKGEKGKEQK